jgi:glycosyltransferase involved in cell wall biosynthesis
MIDLRILIELNSADLRIGAVNDALDLAELAAPEGVRFVLCGPLTRELCDEAARRGIETLRARSRPFSRRGLPLYVIDVFAWMVRLARWRPDVVHLNYAGYGPSLACAARICGIPIVARAGSGPVNPDNLSNRWVAAYAANCREHAADLLDSSLAPRVVVTGDLFRPDRVRSTMVPERVLPPRRTGVARLVFLGQLVERKGLHVLIEAFARLQGASELLIAGGDWSAPGYPQCLKAMARDAGVASRIHFENHRQNVGAVLSTADVFVLPSFSEARPRSIIEAMSLGIPVVASDVGGIPSLVAHEETGLLVPAGDPGALAAAIDRLIQSPDLCSRLGAAGRRRAEEDCRPDRTALEYVRLYRRLIGMHLEPGVLEALLFGEVAATAGTCPRCNILLQRAPLRFDCEPLRTALDRMSAGDCIAYAIALNAPPVARLATLATLPLRLRRIERMIARGGAQVVGRYGIDPNLDAPCCVYELNSLASEYADRCLRPSGAAQALRRILARWFACDPALGGVVVVGRKP